MKFAPKTEKEIQNENLWPAGVYGFEVLEEAPLGANHYKTADRTSKNGNEMIQLVLRVYNPEGHHRTIIDFLLESMSFKLRHAAEACGLLAKYESGSLDASDFIGKSGNLKLRIDKDKTGQYGDKNAVADYAVSRPDVDPQAPPPATNGTAFIDDSTIPF